MSLRSHDPGTLTEVRGLWMTAVVAVLVAGACGADSASAPTPGAPAANAPATTAPATTAPGTGAPATPPPPQQASETLPLVGGGTFDAGRLDQGPLALWFWAPG